MSKTTTRIYIYIPGNKPKITFLVISGVFFVCDFWGGDAPDTGGSDLLSGFEGDEKVSPSGTGSGLDMLMMSPPQRDAQASHVPLSEHSPGFTLITIVINASPPPHHKKPVSFMLSLFRKVYMYMYVYEIVYFYENLKTSFRFSYRFSTVKKRLLNC